LATSFTSARVSKVIIVSIICVAITGIRAVLALRINSFELKGLHEQEVQLLNLHEQPSKHHNATILSIFSNASGISIWQ
jgi:hypothetical protein